MSEKIAILGWGSLIWRPKNLMIKYTKWKNDGPKLPIEFARKSNDGRLTLVIYDKYLDDESKWIKVLWNLMNVDSIQEAIGNVCIREGTTLKRIGFIYKVTKKYRKDFSEKNGWCSNIKDLKDYIGKISGGDYYYSIERGKEYKKVIKVIEAWKKEKEVDAVVWTDLSSNFATNKEIIEYVRNICCTVVKELAIEYIKNTPPQIKTPLREEIEKILV